MTTASEVLSVEESDDELSVLLPEDCEFMLEEVVALDKLCGMIKTSSNVYVVNESNRTEKTIE